jgi:ATP-dependent exoDNAse (exonuclease V) alpha subunit
MASLTTSKQDVEQVREERTLKKYRDLVNYQIDLAEKYVKHKEYLTTNTISDEDNDEESISLWDALIKLNSELNEDGLYYLRKMKKEPYKFTLKKFNLIYYKISKSECCVEYLWYLFNNLFNDDFNGWWELTKHNIATFKQANRLVNYYGLQFNEIDRLSCYLKYEMLYTTKYDDIYHKKGSIKNIIANYLLDYRKDLYNVDYLIYKNKKIEELKKHTPSILETLINNEIIYKVKRENKIYYVLSFIFEQGQEIETHLTKLMNVGVKMNDEFTVDNLEGLQPDKDQVEAVKMAITNAFSMITGGPGRGKTWAIALFIKYLQQNLSKCKIMCVAVAGTAANQLNISLREKLSSLDHIEIGTFAKKIIFNQELIDPTIENYVFIVDETSMVNQNQFYYLLEKIKKIGYEKCKLVLMGDSEQLPSIGLGNILNDLIDSKKFSNKKLTKIHRTESKYLIKMLDAIKNKSFDTGKAAVLKKKLKDINNKSIYIHHTQEIKDNFRKNKSKQFIERLKKKIQGENIHPRNTIFISPENGPKWANEGIPKTYKTKSHFCSVHHLNVILRDIFNPVNEYNEKYNNGDFAKEIPRSNTGLKGKGDKFTLTYRTGDRIQFNTNEYQVGRPDIYRGMLGTIKNYKITENRKTVIDIVFDDLPNYTHSISLDDLNSDDVNLGYAMSVHKSQGITKDNVFMFVMDNHSYSLSQNGKALGYVGCSRAKHNLFIFTNGNSLDNFTIEKSRRTGLFKNYKRIE